MYFARRLASLLSALTLFALPATAEERNMIKIGDLMLTTPYVLETPPNARAAAAYVTIENTGAADELLLSVATPIARAELHNSETDAAGVTRMIHQEAGIPIPAGETVTFAPGGLHIMLMGLESAPSADDAPLIMLTFRDAGEVMLNFDVLSRDAAPATGHGGHGDMKQGSHGN